jgi:Zn-finger nucleic acid-binding protein
VRHVTRHVDRKLYAIEFHRCDRCRHIFFSHGHYTLHWCADPEWTKINNRAYPEPVVYDGDSSVHRRQQAESVRSRWAERAPIGTVFSASGRTVTLQLGGMRPRRMGRP